MTTLDDLYVHYSRQHGCLPNSGFRNQLRQMYQEAGNTRNISELSLGLNYLGPKGLLPAFDLIRNLHSLQSVDISGNGLDNDDAIALVEACSRHPSLTRIDASRNSLHDASTPLFLKLLKDNTRILNLVLTGNNFSASSREKINALLDSNRETPSATVNSSAGLVPARATPFRAILEDFITAAESGGSLSYEYSWRKNPQYRLAVNKASKTRITLTVAEPVATRLVGFTLLRTKDARKVLITDKPQHSAFAQFFKHDQPLSAAKFVGETTYSDTSCTLELDLDATSTPCDNYIIIPHTFQPGKAFSFKLTCEVPPLIENCATVTLERVPDADSWLLNEIEGAWTDKSAGGPLTQRGEVTVDGGQESNPCWRLNDMIRVRLDNAKSKSEPARHQSAVTYFVLLSIQNEETTTSVVVASSSSSSSSSSSTNVEYKIGMDILRPETSECVDVPRRPLRGVEKLYSYPLNHQTSTTTIAFAFDTRCNDTDADFFLVPSLQSPGLTKSYRVAVFSSVCVAASVSAQGSEWACRQLPQGKWAAETCGGCRADNPTTWINNPCYRIFVPEPYPVDMLLVLTSPGPAGGSIFRCENESANESIMKVVDCSVELDEANIVGGSNSNNNGSGDSTSTKRLFVASSTRQSSGVCTLWCNNLEPGKEYWIIPQSRVAGTFAPFKLNIMTSGQILVLNDDDNNNPTLLLLPSSLSSILRRQQLARYDQSNAAKKSISSSSSSSHPNIRSISSTNNSINNSNTNGVNSIAAATTLRENAVKLYGSTGEMFVDRDFPRGPSSLWLNAMDKPVLLPGTRAAVGASGKVVPDFPEEIVEWSRLTEMVTAPTFSPLLHVNKNNNNNINNNNMTMGVQIQGVDDSWFFSAVCAVAAKKSLASALVIHSDFAVGIFQFRFFKNGRPLHVCIDDYVPLDGAGALCFSKSQHADDLFFPLIEKAWAKLHRCYEALDEFSTTPATVNQKYLLDGSRKKTSGFASTSSLISQALADLTGGIPIERSLSDQEGQEWAALSSTTKGSTALDRYSVSFWELLRDSHTEDVVVGLRICSTTQPRALEKSSYSGLFLDRLYPVLEAVEAEGVKLICVLNPYGWENNDDERQQNGGWTKGKWILTDENKNWTAARRAAFDVVSRPANSFWISYEELVYYFGVVHYVDIKAPNVYRVNCPIASFGGPPESREWVYNTQYALNLVDLLQNEGGDDEEESAQKFATVIIGLHDQDRRVSITRESGAKVDYSQRTRIPLRIAVLEVPQNERKVTVLSDANEVIVMSSPPSSITNARDIYYTVDIPLFSSASKNNNNKNRKFIIMPCYDTAVPQDYSPMPPQLNCVLSVFIPGLGASALFRNRIRPTLSIIEDDRSITVVGEWNSERGTAGGPETYPEWRSNPQFLLYPTTASSSSSSSNEMISSSSVIDAYSTITIILSQRNAVGSTVDHIGFAVLDTLGGSSSSSSSSVAGAARIMHFDPASVIACAPHQNTDAVSVSIKVRSISDRKGIPYVIVPSTSKPGASTGFSITVISNRPMQLKQVASSASITSTGEQQQHQQPASVAVGGEFDWKIVRMPGQKISVAEGTAGGSTKFSSWRNNAQYCCRFPVGKTGRLMVTMIKRGAATKFAAEEKSVGLICFHGDEKSFGQGGRRKRLFYRAEDVAALGTSSSGLSAEIDLNFTNCTGSLLVMPFADLPFTEVDFDLCFYSTVDVTVEKALEWNQYTATESASTTTTTTATTLQHSGSTKFPAANNNGDQFGSWAAGSTAGGPRHAHGWINNPFYSITVAEPTRVFALCMQYPHGPEKLMPRKVGRQRVYIPPPIVNDHLSVEFGLDLVEGNSKADFPAVACSQPTRLAETFVSAILEPLVPSDGTGSKQYIVVPHTQQAGIEADYKIILYTDKPVEFTKLPPSDLYRGRNF